MRKTLRYVQHLIVGISQLEAEPFAECGRASADIDCDIKDPALRATNELCLRVGADLIVESAQGSSVYRLRMIRLHECIADTGISHLPNAVGSGEPSSVVADGSEFHPQNAGQRGFMKLHAVNQVKFAALASSR